MYIVNARRRKKIWKKWVKKNLADKVGNNILRDNEHKQFLL